MKTLGISAFYHDASAAIVEDGRVVASLAEERVSRIKHDASFPTFAIEHCLDRAGVRADELDAIVFYEQPYAKFTRVLTTLFRQSPASRTQFVEAARGWLGDKLWVRHHISSKLSVHPRLIEFCDHHDSHAAQAFLQSGFGEAAILTVDAVGEWAATTIACGRSGGEGPIRRLLQIDYPNSLGLFYSTFTAFLGFAPNDAECSTMALASFGTPRFEEEVRRILTIEDDGTYRVDPAYFSFETLDRYPFTARFVELFGAPREADRPLRFDSTADGTDGVTPDERRYADIAASVQRVLEDVLVRLARTAKRLTGLDSLCIAGGVAMNCVAMTSVATQAGFENVFIPPDPGDGGAAAGAALLRSARSSYRVSPYLGADYPIAPAAAMMETLDFEHLATYRSATASQYGGVRVNALDERSVVARTVDALQAGKIVGWFRGRSETGPRALGNRSILCAPARLDVVRRLSSRVKRRAAFRPYALAVAEDSRDRVLTETRERDLGEWMQRSYRVRSQALDHVRGATHIDGTTRAQICDAAANPPFYRLLQTFGEASGTAALLNTSFNEAGSPLVETPEEALIMFLRSDMDCLALENVFLEKRA